MEKGDFDKIAKEFVLVNLGFKEKKQQINLFLKFRKLYHDQSKEFNESEKTLKEDALIDEFHIESFKEFLKAETFLKTLNERTKPRLEELDFEESEIGADAVKNFLSSFSTSSFEEAWKKLHFEINKNSSSELKEVFGDWDSNENELKRIADFLRRAYKKEEQQNKQVIEPTNLPAIELVKRNSQDLLFEDGDFSNMTKDFIRKNLKCKKDIEINSLLNFRKAFYLEGERLKLEKIEEVSAEDLETFKKFLEGEKFSLDIYYKFLGVLKVKQNSNVELGKLALIKFFKGMSKKSFDDCWKELVTLEDLKDDVKIEFENILKSIPNSREELRELSNLRQPNLKEIKELFPKQYQSFNEKQILNLISQGYAKDKSFHKNYLQQFDHLSRIFKISDFYLKNILHDIKTEKTSKADKIKMIKILANFKNNGCNIYGINELLNINLEKEVEDAVKRYLLKNLVEYNIDKAINLKYQNTIVRKPPSAQWTSSNLIINLTTQTNFKTTLKSELSDNRELKQNEQMKLEMTDDDRSLQALKQIKGGASNKHISRDSFQEVRYLYSKYKKNIDDIASSDLTYIFKIFLDPSKKWIFFFPLMLGTLMINLMCAEMIFDFSNSNINIGEHLLLFFKNKILCGLDTISSLRQTIFPKFEKKIKGNNESLVKLLLSEKRKLFIYHVDDVTKELIGEIIQSDIDKISIVVIFNKKLKMLRTNLLKSMLILLEKYEILREDKEIFKLIISKLENLESHEEINYKEETSEIRNKIMKIFSIKITKNYFIKKFKEDFNICLEKPQVNLQEDMKITISHQEFGKSLIDWEKIIEVLKNLNFKNSFIKAWKRLWIQILNASLVYHYETLEINEIDPKLLYELASAFFDDGIQKELLKFFYLVIIRSKNKGMIKGDSRIISLLIYQFSIINDETSKLWIILLLNEISGEIYIEGFYNMFNLLTDDRVLSLNYFYPKAEYMQNILNEFTVSSYTSKIFFESIFLIKSSREEISKLRDVFKKNSSILQKVFEAFGFSEDKDTRIHLAKFLYYARDTYSLDQNQFRYFLKGLRSEISDINFYSKVLYSLKTYEQSINSQNPAGKKQFEIMKLIFFDEDLALEDKDFKEDVQNYILRFLENEAGKEQIICTHSLEIINSVFEQEKLAGKSAICEEILLKVFNNPKQIPNKIVPKTLMNILENLFFDCQSKDDTNFKIIHSLMANDFVVSEMILQKLKKIYINSTNSEFRYAAHQLLKIAKQNTKQNISDDVYYVLILGNIEEIILNEPTSEEEINGILNYLINQATIRNFLTTHVLKTLVKLPSDYNAKLFTIGEKVSGNGENIPDEFLLKLIKIIEKSSDFNNDDWRKLKNITQSILERNYTISQSFLTKLEANLMNSSKKVNEDVLDMLDLFIKKNINISPYIVDSLLDLLKYTSNPSYKKLLMSDLPFLLGLKLAGSDDYLLEAQNLIFDCVKAKSLTLINNQVFEHSVKALWVYLKMGKQIDPSFKQQALNMYQKIVSDGILGSPFDEIGACLKNENVLEWGDHELLFLKKLEEGHIPLDEENLKNLNHILKIKNDYFPKAQQCLIFLQSSNSDFFTKFKSELMNIFDSLIDNYKEDDDDDLSINLIEIFLSSEQDADTHYYSDKLKSSKIFTCSKINFLLENKLNPLWNKLNQNNIHLLLNDSNYLTQLTKLINSRWSELPDQKIEILFKVNQITDYNICQFENTFSEVANLYSSLFLHSSIKKSQRQKLQITNLIECAIKKEIKSKDLLISYSKIVKYGQGSDLLGIYKILLSMFEKASSFSCDPFIIDKVFEILFRISERKEFSSEFSEDFLEFFSKNLSSTSPFIRSLALKKFSSELHCKYGEEILQKWISEKVEKIQSNLKVLLVHNYQDWINIFNVILSIEKIDFNCLITKEWKKELLLTDLISRLFSNMKHQYMLANENILKLEFVTLWNVKSSGLKYEEEEILEGLNSIINKSNPLNCEEILDILDILSFFKKVYCEKKNSGISIKIAGLKNLKKDRNQYKKLKLEWVVFNMRKYFQIDKIEFMKQIIRLTDNCSYRFIEILFKKFEEIYEAKEQNFPSFLPLLYENPEYLPDFIDFNYKQSHDSNPDKSFKLYINTNILMKKYVKDKNLSENLYPIIYQMLEDNNFNDSANSFLKKVSKYYAEKSGFETILIKKIFEMLSFVPAETESILLDSALTDFQSLLMLLINLTKKAFKDPQSCVHHLEDLVKGTQVKYTPTMEQLPDLKVVVGSIKNCSRVSAITGKAISSMTEEDIKLWADKVRKRKTMANIDEEILAVIRHSFSLNILKEKLNVVDNQIICCIMALIYDKGRGKLLELATGEGKTLIIATMATYFALNNIKVDINTSSPVLAKRDEEKYQNFFKAFNLTSGYIKDDYNSKGPKACYKFDIVYGATFQFVFDTLRDEYFGQNTLGNRKRGVLIIDEVDSLLLDECSKIARISSSNYGFDKFQIIYYFIWKKLNTLSKMIVHIRKKNYFIKEETYNKEGKYYLKSTNQDLESLIEDKDQNILEPVEKIEEFKKKNLIKLLDEFLKKHVSNGSSTDLKNKFIPEYFIKFIDKQKHIWIESALIAEDSLLEGQDYILMNGEILPVDYNNTGIIQAMTSWGNGIHQFLQLKHGLTLKPESLNTVYLSYMGYFKRYKENIYGLSGTLGSINAQKVLFETYRLSIILIPREKKRNFLYLGIKTSKTLKNWYDDICTSALIESDKKRGVLIICESIFEANLLGEKLLNMFSEEKRDKFKIKMYTMNTMNQEKNVQENLECGEIIVSTNLAGRGTDIITSTEVENNGGMHVILTFLPRNQRVENQAFGRTSRKGKKGSGEMILYEGPLYSLLNKHMALLSNKYFMSRYKKEIISLRDLSEQESLDIFVKKDKFQTEVKDKIFKKYCDFKRKISNESFFKKYDTNKGNFLLLEIQERWGLFCAEHLEVLNINNGNAIEKFEKEFLNPLESAFQESKTNLSDKLTVNKLLKNPFHLVNYAYSKIINKTGNSIKFDEEALNIFKSFENKPDSPGALVGYTLLILFQKKFDKSEIIKSISQAISLCKLEIRAIAKCRNRLIKSNEIRNNFELNNDNITQLNNKEKILNIYYENLKENKLTLKSMQKSYNITIRSLKTNLKICNLVKTITADFEPHSDPSNLFDFQLGVVLLSATDKKNLLFELNPISSKEEGMKNVEIFAEKLHDNKNIFKIHETTFYRLFNLLNLKIKIPEINTDRAKELLDGRNDKNFTVEMLSFKEDAKEKWSKSDFLEILEQLKKLHDHITLYDLEISDSKSRNWADFASELNPVSISIEFLNLNIDNIKAILNTNFNGSLSLEIDSDKIEASNEINGFIISKADFNKSPSFKFDKDMLLKAGVIKIKLLRKEKNRLYYNKFFIENEFPEDFSSARSIIFKLKDKNGLETLIKNNEFNKFKLNIKLKNQEINKFEGLFNQDTGSLTFNLKLYEINKESSKKFIPPFYKKDSPKLTIAQKFKDGNYLKKFMEIFHTLKERGINLNGISRLRDNFPENQTAPLSELRELADRGMEYKFHISDENKVSWKKISHIFLSSPKWVINILFSNLMQSTNQEAQNLFLTAKTNIKSLEFSMKNLRALLKDLVKSILNEVFHKKNPFFNDIKHMLANKFNEEFHVRNHPFVEMIEKLIKSLLDSDLWDDVMYENLNPIISDVLSQVNLEASYNILSKFQERNEDLNKVIRNMVDEFLKDIAEKLNYKNKTFSLQCLFPDEELCEDQVKKAEILILYEYLFDQNYLIETDKFYKIKFQSLAESKILKSRKDFSSMFELFLEKKQIEFSDSYKKRLNTIFEFAKRLGETQNEEQINEVRNIFSEHILSSIINYMEFHMNSRCNEKIEKNYLGEISKIIVSRVKPKTNDDKTKDFDFKNILPLYSDYNLRKEMKLKVQTFLDKYCKGIEEGQHLTIADQFLIEYFLGMAKENIKKIDALKDDIENEVKSGFIKIDDKAIINIREKGVGYFGPIEESFFLDNKSLPNLKENGIEAKDTPLAVYKKIKKSTSVTDAETIKLLRKTYSDRIKEEFNSYFVLQSCQWLFKRRPLEISSVLFKKKEKTAD